MKRKSFETIRALSLSDSEKVLTVSGSVGAVCLSDLQAKRKTPKRRKGRKK